MNATVYKARYDDGRVEVDWLLVGSLQQLEDALKDGWLPSEAEARAALAAVAPVTPEPVSEPEPTPEPEPTDAVTPTRGTARKKR